jgi:hypothetical protein
MRTRNLAPTLIVALFWCSSARAQNEADHVSTQDPDADAAEEAKHQIDRTWLYADDARVAAPLTIVGITSLSYTNAGSSPTRIDSPFGNTYNAFAANTAQPGAMMTVGGELGLIPHLSVVALGQLGAGGEASTPNAGGLAGLRLQLLPLAWTSTHLAASIGYLREAWEGPVYDDDANRWYPGNPHGDNGGWMQLAFAQDVRRFRFATTVHAEHIFADGRDPLDMMVNLGASYRVAGGFRAGLEYVGQDLEETFSPGAEGGARHFAGPIASLQLLSDRLSIVAGPAIGLSSTSPAFLGRVGVAYGF